jgi:hypothetical protein
MHLTTVNNDQHNSIRKWEPISFTTAAKVKRPWSPINPLLHQSIELPASCLRHGIEYQLNVSGLIYDELIYDDLPLYSTYIMLQMADQSHRFLKGVARDVPVKIKDHYVLTDFVVIDMGDEEQDPPIVLGRPFLYTTRAIIYIRTGEIHFQFRTDKVRCYFNTYTNSE